MSSGGPSQLLIEQIERGVEISEVHVEQRQMPPVVRSEHIVGCPVGFARLQPLDAFGDAALHFHDMGHRVHCPAVTRLQFEGAARSTLRVRILIAFLQAESMHAEDVRIARNFFVPVRQHARNAIAQIQRITLEKIHQMRGLNGERVARMFDQDRIESARCFAPLAVDEQLGRIKQIALARIHLRPQRRGLGDRFAHRRQVALLGRRIHRERVEQMRERKFGISLQRLLHGGKRIAGIAVKLRQRGFEMLQRLRAGS